MTTVDSSNVLSSALWRKYGRKERKEHHVRHYYRCNVVAGCTARKQRTLSLLNGVHEEEDIGQHSHDCVKAKKAHAAMALMEMAHGDTWEQLKGGLC